MLGFLVILLWPKLIWAVNFGSPSGLTFDVNSGYAHTYEDYKPKDYKMEYGVSDPHTGDHKSHWEVRENGIVRGEYSLLEPDGTTRIVQYTADENGFRAVVKKIGQAVHPEPVQYSPEIHQSPIIVPETHPEQPHFKTYDGAAENYATVVDDSSLHQLYKYQPHLEVESPQTPVSHGNIYIAHEDPIAIHSVPPHSDTIQHPGYYQTETDIQDIQEPYIHAPGLFSAHNVIYQYLPSNIHETVGNIPQSVHIKEPIHISAPTPTVENILPLKDEGSTLGISIKHPHGDSSSSFIAKTGNYEDDSAYTNYGKVSSHINSYNPLSGHESSLPYSYLSKRENKEK